MLTKCVRKLRAGKFNKFIVLIIFVTTYFLYTEISTPQRRSTASHPETLHVSQPSIDKKSESTAEVKRDWMIGKSANNDLNFWH